MMISNITSTALSVMHPFNQAYLGAVRVSCTAVTVPYTHLWIQRLRPVW